MKTDRAVLVFCEGRHDVIFVQRVLGQVGGLHYFEGKVSELPTPLGTDSRSKSVILNRYSADRSDLALSATNRSPRPTFESVLYQEKASSPLYVLLNRGTDTFKKPAQDLVDDLTQNVAPDFVLKSWAVAILVDADDYGEKARAEKLLGEMDKWESGPKGLRHGTWSSAPFGPIGLFVFSRKEDGKGTLDDHLVEIFRQHSSGPIAGAESYIDQHRRDSHPVSKKPADRLKAIMTAAGQLKTPGHPLSVVISRSGDLPASAFDTPLARELTTFLLSVPWSQPAE